MLQTKKEKFSLSCELDEFAEIGVGIPQFFQYLKAILIIMVIFFTLGCIV